MTKLNAAVKPQTLRIGFIGAGRLGKALAWSLAGAGMLVSRAASSKLLDAQALAESIPLCEAVTAQQVVNDCDLVFVLTPDNAIASTVAGLRWWAGQGGEEIGRAHV